MAVLTEQKVNMVFDVGANTAQFGRKLREAGYRGRIVSFEPLSSVWDQLSAESKNDPLWEVAPPSVIGNENGKIEIHVDRNPCSW